MSKPTWQSILLTKALIDFSKNAIPGKVFDIAPESLIAYFTGAKISTYLNVSNQPGCSGFVIPAMLASIFHVGEHLEGNSRKIDHIANTLSNNLMHAMVKYFNRYKNITFEIPGEFRSLWIPT